MSLSSAFTEELRALIVVSFLKESHLDSARSELLMMTGRADALMDELVDTKRKLSKTVEAKTFLHEELTATERLLAESRHQVILLKWRKMTKSDF